MAKKDVKPTRKRRWTAKQRARWKSGDYVDNHYSLKEERDQLLANLADVKAEMAEIEGEAKAKFGKEGLEGARGKAAVGYIESREHYNVADRAALNRYVRRTGNVDIFQGRVTVDVTVAYYNEHGKLPPGVGSYEKEEFRTRKA